MTNFIKIILLIFSVNSFSQYISDYISPVKSSPNNYIYSNNNQPRYSQNNYVNRTPSRTEYEVKTLPDGRRVKVPKKQYFDFEGNTVLGEHERPFETNLGRRKPPNRKSLIPVRKNFRQEAVEVMGYPKFLLRSK